ncbi:hypothetical protein JIP62_04875 [Brevundimonas vitis]|uniref:Uncharacterized protein n=1 Tax=Brevundimonas vitisensis TaxID=2800818 RepID=A0ABX7BPB5_9CAUL|nr:hypothetical protein [Brevundimonas vitisensis]QQQ19434.1 hypothetical protein JIP62_04875 [Brevundimonas vitisensis]
MSRQASGTSGIKRLVGIRGTPGLGDGRGGDPRHGQGLLMDGLDTAGLFELALDLQRARLCVAPCQFSLRPDGLKTAPFQPQRVPSKSQSTTDPEDEKEADDRSSDPDPGLHRQGQAERKPPHG